MSVTYGQGAQRGIRGGLRARTCDAAHLGSSAVASKSTDSRRSSEVLLQAGRTHSELNSAVVVEAAEALSGLMGRCRTGLEDGQLAVAAAVWGTERLLGRGGCPHAKVSGVRMVAGRRAMARTLAEVLDKAVRDRLSLSTLPYAPGTRRRIESDARLAARGVRLRALHQRPVVRLDASPPGSVEVRTADLVPMDMLVVDGELALLPVDPDRPGLALIVVTDPAWVRLASVVAESCWARAEGADDGR